MKIYLYLSNQVKIFYLPEIVSGSYSFDIDENEVDKLINVNSKDDKWILSSTDECKVLSGSQYVEEDELFQRNDHDLYMRLPINFAEAILGCEKEVPILDGNIILKIPSFSQNNDKLRIKGRGVPYDGSNRQGDLYIIQI